MRAHTRFAPQEHFLNEYLGHAVVEGLVVREPSFSERSQRLVLEVAQSEKVERVSVIADLFPEFRYGDTLRASGILKEPEPFLTDSGAEFDYPSYLAKDGMYHQMSFPKIEVLSHNGGNVLYRTLFRVRRVFVDTLERFLTEPDATLLSGITIGASDGMGEKIEEMFRRVGLIHIVVLSGYNITVVADTVMRLLSFLPRGLMLGGGGTIVVLFVLATGASATSVRAGAMALLALAARGWGQRYDIHRALFLTAFFMVLWNPHILLFDPSFQLSFLATFGLITLSPVLERFFKHVTNTFSLRQTLSATLATQTFVMPLLVSLSGQVSLISLLANVLVLPVVPLSMFFGSLLGIFGSVSDVLGVALSFPATAITRYILSTSEVLAHAPFASVSVPHLPWWATCVVYVLLLLAIRARARTSHSLDSS
ncbi:MAG: hypothetical protein AMXMBFR44_0720 [Candidatus Campbellbacteria bacterium]